MSDDALLRVTEIFHSLQGESRSTGWPTVFVRLTGCPLRCGYCDTAYAFKGGEWMSIADIVSAVGRYAPRYVTVTGGEPLAQRDCVGLLSALCDAGYRVSVETSGAVDICHLDPRVVRVMDLKTPGSGELDKNRLENLECLGAGDQVKFVICDRRDYEWARQMLADHPMPEGCEALISPAYGVQEPSELAEWMLQDRLAARFQLQLHKILWGEERAR